MAKPTLLSQTQIQTRMLSKLISLLGLNDINAGSVLDVLTSAAAQEDFALYFALAQISRLRDLDALTGDELDDFAAEIGIPSRYAARKSTGNITIQRPATFEEVTARIFAGSIPPVIGALTLRVNDASDALYGTSGTLIVGYGTETEEEVNYSVAPVDNTTYYQFTIDSPGFVNNHDQDEIVLLKQDQDRAITAGTIVRVEATSTAPEIQFSVDNDVTVEAGKAEETEVAVTCTEVGSIGNIGVRAIDGSNAFSSAPFTGARAYNPAKFTTGRDRETDTELKARIRAAGDYLTRGVKNAILNAIVGLVDPVTAKRVVSAAVVLPVTTEDIVKIFIDDGTGFEPTFTEVAQEDVRISLAGGESRLQLDNFPLAKAFLETGNEETYDFSGGTKTLIVEVGALEETISFGVTDFVEAEEATAEEVAQIINDNATLIEARTSDSGSKVIITAIENTNEDLQVTGGTANAILGFPTTRKYTLKLYKDDVLLSKDGRTATIDSQNSPPYNLSLIGGFPQTLVIRVDGKSANDLTATFQSADAANTAAVTTDEIATVINRDCPGVLAIALTDGVRLQSKTLLSADSKIKVNSGDLNDATYGLNFDTTEVVGANADYTMNAELGLIELEEALAASEIVTAGSLYTRAYLRAAIAEDYAPANTTTLVISVDGGGNQTVTFDASMTGGADAATVAAFINTQLVGATAIAREYGDEYYLEIRTNSFATTGSIRIQSSSTGNAPFGFTEDTTVSNIDPNYAYLVSGNAGPYSFVEDSNLIVVLDDDIVNNTYNIVLNYPGTVTGGSSTTVFAASALATPFDSNDEINGYYVAFLTGANTVSGTVTTVADQTGNVFRYTFDPIPGTWADFAVGDLVKFEDLDDSGNNGSFIITGKNAGGWIEVTNPNGVNATVQTGTGTIGQRRAVSDYVASTGTITLGSALTTTPVATETFILLPATTANVVAFLNNVHVTPLSLKADILAAANATKVQISSKEYGSDGAVNVSGGSANTPLGFSTTKYVGVASYAHWTGLTKLVHQTVYGLDSDLDSYPGYGAAGIIFQILAPTVTELSFNINVTLAEGVSLAALENEIKSVVTEYVNNLGVGEDCILEALKAAIMAIDGVIDVSISMPSANEAAADNEVLRTDSTKITLG